MPKAKPAAQAAFAKKAAAAKATSEAKRPQPLWLRQSQRGPAAQGIETPLSPERTSAANRSQAPPRLLSKADILAIANVSFPTIWYWMRAGTFPRSRIVGGKSMWVSTEIEAWLAGLPVRPLKGDSASKENTAA
jgi:predicted DNA-binding transcriptional regulator AlpA